MTDSVLLISTGRYLPGRLRTNIAGFTVTIAAERRRNRLVLGRFTHGVALTNAIRGCRMSNLNKLLCRARRQGLALPIAGGRRTLRLKLGEVTLPQLTALAVCRQGCLVLDLFIARQPN